MLVGGGGRFTGPPTVSADGRYVAYFAQGRTVRSEGAVILADLSQPFVQLTVVDGKFGRGSGLFSGAEPVEVSADGTAVAFWSVGRKLIPGIPRNQVSSVYRYAIAAGTLTRVSTAFDHGPDMAVNSDPTISANGRFITYTDEVSAVPTDARIVRYDALTATSELIFAGTSTATSISGDGQHIAFSSSDPSLVGPDDTNNADDIYLWTQR